MDRQRRRKVACANRGVLPVGHGIAHPAWPDDSDSTGNTDGALRQLDIYTAAVAVP